MRAENKIALNSSKAILQNICNVCMYYCIHGFTAAHWCSIHGFTMYNLQSAANGQDCLRLLQDNLTGPDGTLAAMKRVFAKVMSQMVYSAV